MRASGGAVALLATGGAGAAVLLASWVSSPAIWQPEVLPACLLALSFYVGGAVAVLGGRHRAAHRLLAVGALHLAAFGLSGTTELVLQAQVPGAWLVNLASSLLFLGGLAAFVGLLAVFPSGTYERWYERRATQAAAALAVLVPVVDLLARPRQTLALSLTEPPSATRSPVHLPALEPLAGAEAVISVLPLLGVTLFVLRYRRATHEARMRMRWPLVSAVVGGLGLAAHLVPGVPPALAGAVVVTGLASFPAALVVGIGRHRLLDVDLVLSRTLVYGVLWSAIALAYGVGAAAVGLAAGARVDVSVAVVLTIVTALIFEPARRRLERVADRLVHGRRRDGYPLLRELGARLEHGVGAADVAEAVVRTVASGLEPRWVRLRVVDDLGRWTTLACAGPAAGQPAMSAELSDRDGRVGVLECGPPGSGSWSDADRDLLGALARAAALAVRRARLASDLAASRARLVQAQDEERRRLERDLHDGAQQHLVALMAALEVARIEVAREPQRAAQTLRRAQDVARDAHRALRELARGIRPPVLGDRGLVAAVEAQLAVLPLDVRLEVDPTLRSRRFAPEVEAAAYFLIAEGLTNVAKHAGPARVRVRMHGDGTDLCVDVADDGPGFDITARPPGGLSGLRDRVEALGGGLVVEAAPGCGTTLRAVLPTQEGHAD